ncbi:3-hydroxybutyryl-CoA dehydrogenase [Clostridium saccharoperbutylacetonicum]|uniref:3-hydroxybutyryl-CoA dehydrogenase Hbd n=1 Tax=Clostridium saccharoperbutylacetonicum N1-4(HMT) TaxID=931276 RepID=M1MDN8_9CLOT|nr:3-hydroxyacyl-CoA dehydrogenase NAD-binding domain-containing protein [Clostridium saccharoperbutylacetonicum]AGF56034.1 3-hydroxybutyryl-CoA dehydrogenase Hbd [Clostridium saccharoperbutylacetonicum N1-4(HMT)]NRT63227.1 3-hydroxybutyryl-CoA dehydrogenase [Clostridium saccharoperbutylacetonicum]NSB26587.1 3-hydroxybutyryl-CoA dehydrogenase [Clostridium saccharoperbutylacetonicum]NSB45938.1 3-hydroxybutyryl-CoA dehydrogenase [Clostridium saccharoperbutylacetonicum]
MANSIRNITVFGPGMMGSGIAQVFAGNEDLKVTIFIREKFEYECMDKIKSNLQVLKENGVITEEKIKGILDRIALTEDLQEAVKDADFIVECIPENMELKQDLFKRLEPICKDTTIFATNTSVMSITEISEKVKDKSRLVGTHFWNPPYLIPLVEVIKSDYTSDEIMDKTMELLKKVEKHPIRVNKDVPGFVANRLQHALWREAISIVEHDIADAATVDEAIKYSFGLRLPVLGPMENSDMVGTDLTLSIHSYILKHLENSTEPSPILKEKVEAGDLGFKTGKGFQEWSADQAKKSNERLRDYLIKVLYKNK